MKQKAKAFFAILLAGACLIGLLTGCQASSSIEAQKKAREESIANAEASREAQALLDAPTEQTAQTTEQSDEDPVVPGKWVLTNTGFKADREFDSDADGEYLSTYSVDLYRHGVTHSYNPVEPVDALDVPWSEGFSCTCTSMPETILPGQPFSVEIEARVEYSDAKVHGVYCYLYCDNLHIELSSAGGHDYSAMAYALYAGSTPGTTWGHDWDAPWSGGEKDTVTVTAPVVTKSLEKRVETFTVEFDSNAGRSRFEYTWIPD